jgi:capsular exopolysaccharide synthesis family protein
VAVERDSGKASARESILDDEERHLHSLGYMYDHLYKVLWKLLSRMSNGNVAVTEEKKNGTKGSNGKKTRKGGYAIVFAGCRDGEGASTMAFNFASAFARYSSKSVALVDGNLRDAVLHHQFRLQGSMGLSDVIQGKSAVQEAIAEITAGKYYFLQAGQWVKNPVSLYETTQFLAVVEQLREKFDLVIFDSPSLIENPESILLANAMDGLIMILEAERTRWEVAKAARSDLESVGVPILGAILNKRPLVIPEAIYRLL